MSAVYKLRRRRRARMRQRYRRLVLNPAADSMRRLFPAPWWRGFTVTLDGLDDFMAKLAAAVHVPVQLLLGRPPAVHVVAGAKERPTIRVRAHKP